MSLRVFATDIRAVALDLLALRPDPSTTTWSRLEPLPTSDDPSEGLLARIADPLWMLARQWQFNELQGEDAGSPIGAALKLRSLPVTTLAAHDGSAPEALGGAAPPVEALVEREQVLEAHPKLNAQAGQQLMRALRAAGLGNVSAALCAAFPARIEAPSDPVGDNAGFVWHALLDGRAIDALALAAKLRPLRDKRVMLASFGKAHGTPAALAGQFADVAIAWLAGLDTLAVGAGTPGASPYWNPQRLEYRFALQTDAANPVLRLVADEYTDGHIDWHSFDVRPDAAAAPVAPAFTDVPPTRPPMPTQARYPGMPSDRYWEFEDGRVNFGMLGAAKSDLARIAVIEYALVFGNDWFVLPVTLPVNALYQVASLVVHDNFGIEVVIPQAMNPDGTPWSMYELSVQRPATAPRGALDDMLFLCPSVETLEGPPLEHVLMMRDEMANLAWGIEKRVQGTSGEPLDRKFESQRLSTDQSLRPPAGAVLAPGGAPLRYRLQTPVAANWIPFLPVNTGSAMAPSIQLQRAVVTHHYPVTPERLKDPRNADYAAFIERLRATPYVETHPEQGSADNRLQGFMFHPRGSLLRTDPAGGSDALKASDYLRIEDEEVPRDGIELKRAFNYARDAQGRALLWIGRSKTTGRGEGASGLRFDVVGRAQG